MFNAARAHAVYQQVLALPDPLKRQEWLQHLDRGLLNVLTRKGLLSTCPQVEVRFDESGIHTWPATGMPGDGRISLGSNAQGQVPGTDGTSWTPSPEADPLWHRWTVLFREAARLAFETLGQAFVPSPEWFSPSMTQVLNTYVFALFVTNPQRKIFEESFADCLSCLVLLSTGAPQALKEVEGLLQARRETRQRQEEAWGQGVGGAERWAHVGDLALRRVLDQAHPVPEDELLVTALHCASDGLVDLWRLNPDRAQVVLERSWMRMDPAYPASRMRRAMEGGYNLAEAWAHSYPNHPWVRLWGPLARQEELAHTDPEHAPAPDLAWTQGWEQVVGRAAPAISHALEGYRDHLSRALQPPVLVTQQRRLPGAWRGGR